MSDLLLLDEETQTTFEVAGVCFTCAKRGVKHFSRGTWNFVNRDQLEFQSRHPGHDVKTYNTERLIPAKLDDRAFVEHNQTPWFLDGMRENTSITIGYAASAAYTLVLEALGSSATFIAGRESTLVLNTSTLNIDFMVGGYVVTNGTTNPTADKEIRVYGIGAYDDTPDWPDQMTGASAARNVTNTYILDTLPLLASTSNNATQAVQYNFSTRSLASTCFGGVIPKNHSLYVTHSTAQNLHASAAGVISYSGVYIVG